MIYFPILRAKTEILILVKYQYFCQNRDFFTYRPTNKDFGTVVPKTHQVLTR